MDKSGSRRIAASNVRLLHGSRGVTVHATIQRLRRDVGVVGPHDRSGFRVGAQTPKVRRTPALFTQRAMETNRPPAAFVDFWDAVYRER